MRQNFGHFIRDRRNELNLTQNQLAYQVNIDSAKLSKIETGKFIFDKKRLELLSSALNVDLVELKEMYFGDCIARTLYSNGCSEKTLLVAEEIFGYYKNINLKQGSFKF